MAKANEILTKEETRASAITRYKDLILTEVKTISKANEDKVKAFVQIGKYLNTLKTSFDKVSDLLDWCESKNGIGLKKAQCKNMMQAAKDENKKHVEAAKKKGLSPTDMMKTIRNGGQGAKAKPASKSEPDFDYSIKRASSNLPKPGEGLPQEVADQLYEAVRSVACGHDGEQSIIDGLLNLLECHIVEPKQANPGTGKADAVPA